jgi:hypothetical protein
LSLYSVKKGYYSEVYFLGVNGRRLVGDYPDLALIILNTLEELAKIVNKVEDEEVRETETKKIIQEVESIGDWNSRNYSHITAKVKQLKSSLTTSK